MGLCRATSYASELVCINAGLGISSMPWLHSACLTAETDLYLDPGKPTYMGGMLEFHNTTVYLPWASMTEALRTGESHSAVKVRTSLYMAAPTPSLQWCVPDGPRRWRGGRFNPP
jgi:hypothetical protein